MQNGIPWWYFHKHGGPHEGRSLESVDPGGIIAQHLPVDQVIGSVVYPAAEIAAPGVIRLIEGNRFSLAELDHSASARIQEVSRVFTAAGFKAPVVSDIRAEIWTKLWGNMSFNPISALTGATLAGICAHPQGRALAADMMREAQAVGEKLGIRFRIPLEKRIAGAQAVGEAVRAALVDACGGKPADVTLAALTKRGLEVQLCLPFSAVPIRRSCSWDRFSATTPSRCTRNIVRRRPRSRRAPARPHRPSARTPYCRFQSARDGSPIFLHNPAQLRA
jgi:2-dehydropantoate 2-reductase